MQEKGVEKIISYIEASAEKDISEMLLRAQQEADSIKKAAQEKAEAEAQRILSQGQRAANLEGQRIIAETKIDVKRKKMDAQEEAIAASFEQATRALKELAEQGKLDHLVYRDIMFGLVASACEIIAGKRVELALNQRDANAFTDKVMGELRAFVKERTGRDISLGVSSETIPCLGGVIVRDLERHVEVDNTLEAKLNRLKERIRVDIARLLFGDEL
jgi:V/A-type H+-transporting ATPase subunit E